jgi:hypothetical protein
MSPQIPNRFHRHLVSSDRDVADLAAMQRIADTRHGATDMPFNDLGGHEGVWALTPGRMGPMAHPSRSVPPRGRWREA